MNINGRLKKLETLNSSGSSEHCTCGHKNKVQIQNTGSNNKNGTIEFVLLPCERCGKPVESNIPQSITFTINPSVQLTGEA